MEVAVIIVIIIAGVTLAQRISVLMKNIKWLKKSTKLTNA
jgi:hypothetical protein